MTSIIPSVVATGESALTVVFGQIIDLALNDRVLALDQALVDDPVPGVSEVVPALASLLVRFDPLSVSRSDLSTVLLERANREVDQAPARRRWTIPARYGGEHGPDLAYVSEAMGLSDEAAIQAHASLRLRVLMLDFAPGLAYLGIAGEPWDIPRRPEGRPRVPPGSVLVAVRQTVVAGTAIPTGWHHIAHTPVPTFQTQSSTIRPKPPTGCSTSLAQATSPLSTRRPS